MTAKWTDLKAPGTRMNKLEAAYNQVLGYRQMAGELHGFAYEAVKLRLAGNTFYTPDFIVYLTDGTVEFHEVKGFWRDDARVKIKVAAENFPFRFVAVTRDKGGWQYEQI